MIEHVPTDDTRLRVERMSGCGIPQEDIGLVIGICKNTLRKHYKTELDTARTIANSEVAGMLYGKCMDGDTTSMIFWLKTRAGWSEKQQEAPASEIVVNIVAPDGL